MEEWQKDWLKPETVKELAAGFIFGGTVVGYFLYRVIKSGFLVLGDKAALIAENAVLTAQKAELEKDLANAESQLAKLKGGGQG